MFTICNAQMVLYINNVIYEAITPFPNPSWNREVIFCYLASVKDIWWWSLEIVYRHRADIKRTTLPFISCVHIITRSTLSSNITTATDRLNLTSTSCFRIFDVYRVRVWKGCTSFDVGDEHFLPISSLLSLPLVKIYSEKKELIPLTLHFPSLLLFQHKYLEKQQVVDTGQERLYECNA